MRKDSFGELKLEWLRAHIDDDVWEKLTIKFNNEFAETKTQHALMNKCQRMGIYKTDKDVYLRHKAKTKVGAERIRVNAYGQPILWVKVSNVMKRKGKSGYYNKIWKAKHRLVYEQHHGALNDNDCIVFLDGDSLNCNIQNLYKTTQSIRQKMLRNDWFSNDRNTTMTALKWCEMEAVLERNGKKN